MVEKIQKNGKKSLKGSAIEKFIKNQIKIDTD